MKQIEQSYEADRTVFMMPELPLHQRFYSLSLGMGSVNRDTHATCWKLTGPGPVLILDQFDSSTCSVYYNRASTSF